MTSSMRQINFSTDQDVDFICFGENLWETPYKLTLQF